MTIFSGRPWSHDRLMRNHLNFRIILQRIKVILLCAISEKHPFAIFFSLVIILGISFAHPIKISPLHTVFNSHHIIGHFYCYLPLSMQFPISLLAFINDLAICLCQFPKTMIFLIFQLSFVYIPMTVLTSVSSFFLLAKVASNCCIATSSNLINWVKIVNGPCGYPDLH